MSGVDSSWKLMKYARMKTRSSAHEGSGGKAAEADWEIIDSKQNSQLTLMLTKSHNLMITCGSKVQENLSLWNAASWMKAVCRGDSIMAIYKIQNESRRFRVKFAGNPDQGQTAAALCQECVVQLSRYITVRRMDTDKTVTDTDIQDDVIMEGNISIPKLAQITAGQLKSHLPLAYQKTNIPTEELGTFIRLCLSDSNFPGFVGQVEREMSKIIKDSE